MTHLGPDHPAFQLTFGADLLADNNCVESMSTLGKPVLPWTHNLDTGRRLQLSAASFPNHQCQDQTRSLKVPSCSWPIILPATKEQYLFVCLKFLFTFSLFSCKTEVDKVLALKGNSVYLCSKQQVKVFLGYNTIVFLELAIKCLILHTHAYMHKCLADFLEVLFGLFRKPPKRK